MFYREKSGDSLANEFLKHLKKASQLRKNAELNYAEDEAKDDQENDASCSSKSYAKDDQENDSYDNKISDNLLSDMLADHGHENETHDAGYDNMIKDFEEDIEITAEQERLMRGLGKIAGSLRRKNEDFAADVVEATALNIRNDFYKKAMSSSKKKEYVVSSLQKIAKDLRNKGESFAADVVITTANKINRR